MAWLNTALFFQIFNLSHRFPFLDNLMVFGAEYLIFFAFLAVIILAFVGGEKERKALIIIIFGLIIELILRKVTQAIYFEPRPFVSYQITPLIKHTADAAFPSGHTTIMAVIAFSYYFYKSKFTPLFLFLMLWVGFARIFVGVHYPLDILGGILVGLLSALLTRQISNHARGRLLRLQY